LFGLLKNIGEFITVPSTTVLNQMADPIGDNYCYGLAICFNKKGKYDSIQITQGSNNVIYKKGPSNGFDFTLVSRQGPKGIAKTIDRTCKNAEVLLSYFDQDSKIWRLIQSCNSEMKQNKSTIFDDINKKIPGDLSAEKRLFVYWAQIDNGLIQGFYTFPEIHQFLIDEQMKRYGAKSEAKSPVSAQNISCSICGITADIAYGNFTDIQCYNLDKIGVITGGFDYNKAPYNFPICQQCILNVRSGKKFTEENLSFSLAGHPYWLLPQTDSKVLFQIVLDSIDDSKSRQSLGKDIDTITASENELLDILSDNMESQPGLLTLNMIFYKKNKEEWRIRSEIREILPSRISELYKAKHSIQKRPEMIMSKREQEENRYHFTLKKVNPFCGDSGKQSEKKFLLYIESIFKGSNLQKNSVFKDLTDGIISAQKNDLKNNRIYAPFTVRDAWATFLFLTEIGTLSKEGGTEVPETKSDTVYEEYMNANHDFFSNAFRRTAFLTGCYVNSVLYIQKSKRNSQPFEKKFIGKKLNGNHLKSLYAQGETKLRQYGALGIVHLLTPLLADSWISCGDKWELSEDETTFAFTLGLTLGSKLATKKSKDNEVIK